jgi:hypothetical protein
MIMEVPLQQDCSLIIRPPIGISTQKTGEQLLGEGNSASVSVIRRKKRKPEVVSPDIK